MKGRAWRRSWRWAIMPLALVVILIAAHYSIRYFAHIAPPSVALPTQQLKRDAHNTTRFGRSSVRRHGNILSVRLSGSPEEIGYAHSRLLYDQMVENEGRLIGHFQRSVGSSLARTLLLDLALLKYHSVSSKMSEARLRELAAMARGFQPDPYRGFFDTFQRFIYLNALYDISLSFEHSPLIGCTTFVLNAARDSDGEPLLARNFDFEVDPIFDRKKAVFLVRENDKIPFASVAWPGLVGVVSGMNAEGVSIVVHGARAGTPSAEGEPVVHALRRVLSSARTTHEAVQQLGQREAMVSHLVVVLDKSGSGVVVERAPGQRNHMRELPRNAGVTNHFEGPLKDDPKNVRVLQGTSTVARRARADELLEIAKHPLDARAAIALLRDRRGQGGRPLALGDRNAIDALIATHAVVMNPRKLELWVSEGPHLLGRFVRFELLRMLDNPIQDTPPQDVSADPALGSAEVRRFLAKDGGTVNSGH